MEPSNRFVAPGPPPKCEHGVEGVWMVKLSCSFWDFVCEKCDEELERQLARRYVMMEARRNGTK